MLEKIRESIQQAGDLLREQAANVGETAKEKAYQLIENWVNALPKMEELGLEVTSFSIGVSINPTLEVELKGTHEDFSLSRIEYILETENIS